MEKSGSLFNKVVKINSYTRSDMQLCSVKKKMRGDYCSFCYTKEKENYQVNKLVIFKFMGAAITGLK